MVRSKLEDNIRSEIRHYLNIPYWIDQWKGDILIKQGPFSGKGHWKEIQYATQCAADFEAVNFKKLSHKDIYRLRHRHHIGIDCSGLVYHLLNRLDQLYGHPGILYKVFGPQKSIGVRHVSADYLTNPINAIPITNYQNIRLGDLIRIDSGRHVIFIINYTKNIITYVHSSHKTTISGVHLGKITITNPQLPLTFQQWSDTTKDKNAYNTFFDSQKGDGIFRPSFLST